MENTAQLLPLSVMARRLRVPVTWLRGEADANRVPHVKAGKAYLFNSAVVHEYFLALAAGNPVARNERREVAVAS